VSPWRFAGFAVLAAVVAAAKAGEPAFFDYGPLAEAVARRHLFSDDKTFADAIPRQAPEEILWDYRAEFESSHPSSNLRGFVALHFILPEELTGPAVPKGQSLPDHLETLWSALRRPAAPQVPGSSLIALSHPYIVPGGRFREMYYWDSYFTLLGLQAGGHRELIDDMAANFADLARRFGLIPNGNRTYYLSRSQPPFFSLMVDLVGAVSGPAAAARLHPALEIEYAYWTDRTPGTRHRVTSGSAAGLSRYYDRLETPRPESRLADETLAEQSHRPAGEVYRELRSAAESGWDFSSRWLGDGKTLATIRTTDLAPVDLNCLLWHLETALGRTAAAEARRQAILRCCWSQSDQFFCDYQITEGAPSPHLSLAGVFPLYFRLASPDQARAVAAKLRQSFLQPGGLVTTLVSTGQQWDAPNGWAPLQWMAIQGLRNYGEDALAAEIAQRWMQLNTAVYGRTGKLMEKYNVQNLELPGGGGEYPGQDGFGWTNGVLAALMHQYPRS